MNFVVCSSERKQGTGHSNHLRPSTLAISNSQMFHVEHSANSPSAPPIQEKGRACARPEVQEEQTQRPKLADCMDCRDRSEVEAMPCMRSLNSSAFEALSRAVS